MRFELCTLIHGAHHGRFGDTRLQLTHTAQNQMQARVARTTVLPISGSCVPMPSTPAASSLRIRSTMSTRGAGEQSICHHIWFLGTFGDGSATVQRLDAAVLLPTKIDLSCHAVSAAVDSLVKHSACRRLYEETADLLESKTLERLPNRLHPIYRWSALWCTHPDWLCSASQHKGLRHTDVAQLATWQPSSCT
jgi:hypothetical protein